MKYNHFSRAIGLMAAVAVHASLLAQSQTTLTSFEDSTDLSKLTTSNATVTIVTDVKTDGAKSLRVKFKPSTTWSYVQYKPTTPWNLTATSGVSFEAVNPIYATTSINIVLYDANGNTFTARYTTGTNGVARLFVPLETESPTNYDLVALLPPTSIYQYRWNTSAKAGTFDVTRVAYIRWFLKAPTADTVMYFDNLKAIGAQTNVDRLSQVADQFGQFSKANFAGKLMSTSDYASRIAVENADLAANPKPANRDSYGGNLMGPALTATGFFRTQKLNGKWWLVTPKGYLFWGVGLTTFSWDSRTPITGREYMFQWLPTSTDPLYQFRGPMQTITPANRQSETFNFHNANLYRKYGVSWSQNWHQTSKQRIDSWAVNLSGAGSGSGIRSYMPWINRINVDGNYHTINAGSYTYEPLPDPYDPLFAQAVAASASANLTASINDKNLIGTLVELEPSWTGLGDEGGRYDLAKAVFTQDSATSPAKEAMVLFLQNRYPSIGALNSAWGTKYASFIVLAGPAPLPSTLNAQVKADFANYTYQYARRYFEICRDAVKLVDPNHLYLGCQLNRKTIDVMQACADVADMVCPTYYQYQMASDDLASFAQLDRPIMIPEYSFASTERGSWGGLCPVNTEADRVTAFQTLTSGLLQVPQIVGACFFRYYDQPVTGMVYGENACYGLVDITDTPSPVMVPALRAFGRNIYTLRSY
ncbi:MAG: hypothetical protein ACOYON_08255 [Fimbriimonas sp.]